MTGRAIIVHSLGHALAALAAAEGLGVSVTLASAPGAAAYLGAGYFQSMVEGARDAYPGAAFGAVLDCGAAPGLALAALRQGLPAVCLRAPAKTLAKVAEIAAAHGALLNPEMGPALDLEGAPDVAGACRDWLG
jgi:hypothetical protein